ncbi:MAG: LytTR family DNA-binding domain-containing protein [Actinomycetota bacterium]
MRELVVLAVDDEDHALSDLAWLLDQAEGIREVIKAQSGTQALKLLGSRTDVDALFLDVQMPGLSGVELVSLLRNYKNPPAVVFVTAFDRYAVDAFDLEAVDYLVKPVDEARLDQTIRRVQRLQVGADGATDTFATLTCRVGRKTYTINRDDVVVVEAAGDLVRLWTEDGESHLVRESISSLTAAWSANGFLRIHRSYLVRAASMASVRSNAGSRSVMILDRELPVSRRYTRLLEEYFARGQ